MTDQHRSGRRQPRGSWSGLRAARTIAVVAACLAVADAFRWGNRWYVATMVAADDPQLTLEITAAAHEALVRGLAVLLVAVVAGAIGWRQRVVRAPVPPPAPAS